MHEEREERELRHEVGDDLGDRQKGVLEDERGGLRRRKDARVSVSPRSTSVRELSKTWTHHILVIRRQVDCHRPTKTLPVEDDGRAPELCVVGDEVECGLRVDLETLLGRGALGETVPSVGEHKDVELHLEVEDWRRKRGGAVSLRAVGGERRGSRRKENGPLAIGRRWPMFPALAWK